MPLLSGFSTIWSSSAGSSAAPDEAGSSLWAEALRMAARQLVKEMKDKGRWCPAAKLVMPASHVEQSCYEDAWDQDMIPEACGKIAIMLLKKVGAKIIDDATTGQVLDERLVKKARQLEMAYFETKKVYTKKPIKECLERTGRQPIGVR